MDLINLKRGSILLLLVFLFIACEQQREPKQYPLHYSDAIFGTSFTIKASLIPRTLKTNELRVQIKQLLDKLNGQMSTYQQDSELSKINANESSEWLTVSTDLYSVLKQANEISVLSNGAFDVTIGPLVNLWGFGPDPMSFVVPEKSLIDTQLKTTGYKKILFDDKTNKIKKLSPDIYIDLSAIAKGYAVDQVGLLLEKQGISNYMVEIGGELRLKGKNISNEPWRIVVEKPIIEMGVIQKVLPLSNISVATSGDYRNFFESGGVRFSHTIDPRFGQPIKHKLASITILSDTTMKADALATALMVLGAEEGYKIAEQEKIAALFIIKTEDAFKEKATPVFLNTLR